jgi:hypothetical protein
MLDNERKKLIEAEEHYRHEIVTKLHSEAKLIQDSAKKIEKNFWSKAAEILNSNFGLWFLSSVVISGGAALYQITQHHYDVKMATQKELLACEFEIANRLNGMKFLLLRAKTNGDAQNALTGVSKSFGAVSAEYEHVNIAVLYLRTIQLTGLMDRQVAHLVKELEEKNLAIQLENPKAPFDEADRKRLIELISTLQLSTEQKINAKEK